MLRRLAFCALGGALGFLGWVGFDLYPLGWVFLVPMLYAIRNVSPRRAILLGWVTGTVGHLGGFHWIVFTLQEFVGVGLPLALGGLLLIALVNGLAFGAIAWIARTLHRSRGVPLGLGVALAWVVVEQFYPMLFPFYLGAGQHPLLPLLQIADVTGPLGVSFLVAFGNGVVFECLFRGSGGLPRRMIGAFLLLLAATTAYGFHRMGAVDEESRAAPSLGVALVQVNIGATEAFSNRPAFLRRHQEMSAPLDADSDVDLVIWPENVVYLSTGVGSRVEFVPGELKKPLLLGTAMTIDGLSSGSAVLVGERAQILSRYDKRRLIPFAEYVPFQEYLPFLEGLSPHQGSYEAGTSVAPLLFGEHRLAMSICYEEVFPAVIREGMAVNPAPHLLVNLTNDSWYGDSIEARQHLVLSTFRAIEHRRALVRSTNTGISALIDPVGRLDRVTPQGEAAILKGRVPLLQGRTFYARFGDWFAWAALIALLALSGLGRGSA